MKIYIFIAIIFIATGVALCENYEYDYVGSCDVTRLTYDIENSTLAVALNYINLSGDILTVVMKGELTPGEENLISYLKENPSTVDLPNEPTEVQVVEGEGAGERLKYYGFKFEAAANAVTNYDFVMPYSANIKGGYIGTVNANTGDKLDFIILPDTPYEFYYVENVYLESGIQLPMFEEKYSVSSELPQGSPLRVIYDNKGSTRTVTFYLEIKVD